MSHLTQEIKELVNKPRLLLQYVIINFFLISVGLAAVMYIKKETIVQQQRSQGELILHVNSQLQNVPLPAKTEQSLEKLKRSAEQSLSDQSSINYQQLLSNNGDRRLS